MIVRDGIDQRAFVLRGRNARQFRLQRVDPFGVRRLLVHARPVEVADLLLDGRTVCPPGRRLLQDVVQHVFIPLIQLDEAHPLRLVRRNLGVLQPVAAGELIEIHAGIDRLVDLVDAETRLGLSGRAWRPGWSAQHSAKRYDSTMHGEHYLE